jgi:hypothetical protein
VNSTPVPIRLRIRVARGCRVNPGAPHLLAGPADELQTTRSCRCRRGLMHLASARARLKAALLRSSGACPAHDLGIAVLGDLFMLG